MHTSKKHCRYKIEVLYWQIIVAIIDLLEREMRTEKRRAEHTIGTRARTPRLMLLTGVRLVLCALFFLQASYGWGKTPSAELVDYYDINHPVIARKGMVVSQNALASEIGAEVLRRGGNAIDAAVAVGFALAVTLPRAGNIAGGGFMLVHLAQQNKTIAIDYREVAPATAYRDMFLDEGGEPDHEKLLHSLASAGVPGTVAGLYYASKKYGSIAWEKLLKPAEKIARHGIYIDDDRVRIFSKEGPVLTGNGETCKVYFKRGCQPYQAGDLIVQQDLANTLAIIGKHGADGFYKGEIADKIVHAMKNGGGFISAADLARYRAREVEPISGTFKGYQIFTMPPPSSGGVHLIQMLNMLEALPTDDIAAGSAALMHLEAEIFKRAYADRSTFLGDPDFIKVPITGLTSKAYAAELAKSIGLKNLTPSRAIKAGQPLKYESPDTTHFSVMDNAGNVVTNTYTLNHNYGSGITIPGTGFFINNTMDDFSAKPGSPNSYGLIGGEANAIAAGKRPLSSMTPTLVMKDGKPYLATGTPGGSKIITAVFQQLVNVLLYDMNIAEATNAPRIHHQWLPDILYVERNIAPDTLRILQEQGYQVEVSKSLGSLQSIMNVNGVYLGAADPRRPGASAAAVN